MTSDDRAGFTPNLVVGIGLTALGVVLTLDRLGVIEAVGWLRYWPVLLIVFGASIAVQAYRGAQAGTPSPPILSAPLVVLLVVAGVLATRVADRGASLARADGSGTVSVHAVMSGNRRTVEAVPFRGGEMTTIMGESRLDLRQAALAPGDHAVVDIVTVMGSAIVYVPDGWEVDFDAVPVMGGVKDERRRLVDPDADAPPETGAPEAPAAVGEPEPAVAAGPAPRLVLRGFILMGGLVVRS